MALARIENSASSSLEEAKKLEGVQDIYNAAIFSIKGDKEQRKEVIDLLNVFTSLNYHSRLWKFPDAHKQSYILHPIGTSDLEDKTVLDDEQLGFIEKELKVIGNTISIEQTDQPKLDKLDLDAEELIIVLCQKFTAKEIEPDIFIPVLREVVVKDAEIAFLEQTGRLNDSLSSQQQLEN